MRKGTQKYGVGDRCGKLEITGVAGRDPKNGVIYRWKCDCGETIDYFYSYALKRGSCGCNNKRHKGKKNRGQSVRPENFWEEDMVLDANAYEGIKILATFGIPPRQAKAIYWDWRKKYMSDMNYSILSEIGEWYNEPFPENCKSLDRFKQVCETSNQVKKIVENKTQEGFFIASVVKQEKETGNVFIVSMIKWV